MINIEYLLKYLSNEQLKELKDKGNYIILENLTDFRVTVEKNIRFLIKYGVKDIDKVVLKMLDEISLLENEFENKILDYEKNLSQEEVVHMLENM